MNKIMKNKIITLLQDIDDFYWCNGIPDYDTEKELSLSIGEVLQQIGGYTELIDERVNRLMEVN